MFAGCILALFLSALFVRIRILGQPLECLDRLFVPDDTYYTLSISRSLAAGHAPSTDGQTVTTGFQPLIAVFQVPLFRFLHGPDEVLHAALLEGAFLGACGTLAVGLLLARISGRGAALLGMLLTALHPLIVKTDLNGLETSLSGFLALLVLLAYTMADERREKLSFVALGALCALALLARIDNCFLVALVVVFGAVRWGLRSVAVLVATLATVGAPWWVYSIAIRGSPVPESGAAVRQIIGFHQAMFRLTPSRAIPFGLATIGSWIAPSAERDKLALAGIAVVLCLVAVGYFIGPKLRPGPGRCTLQIAVASAILLIAFYVLFLPALWFFERYFYFPYLVLSMAAAVGIAELTQSTLQARWWRKRLVEAAAVFSIALFLAGFYGKWRLFFSKPREGVDIAVLGSQGGYREAAREILEHLPQESTLGAMQSGALGYYAQTVRVVNLDGVVNGAAYAALRQRKLEEYLRREHVGYFADWDINLLMLKYFWGEKLDADRVRPMFVSRQRQGINQFTLYKLIFEN